VLSPAQVIDGQAFQPQVRPYETEVTVGWWRIVKYSGQLDPKVQQDMRARAVKVSEAVRKAREQANRLEVTDRSASPLLDYVFSG
jgi:alkylated DNA nucleotide flippase Atl1